MTITDRFLGHDAWTTRQLLLRCRELSNDRLDQKFDIGDRSLRQTFVHMIECMELHLDRALGRPERRLATDYSVEALLVCLQKAATELADFTDKVEREGSPDKTWIGPSGRVRTYGGVIVHLITHNMHHRAQAMYLMEKLGLMNVIEGDALGWESMASGLGWDNGGSYGTPVAE